MNQNSSMPTGRLYLNIIWHQHQPLYLDPATDQLQGPWVRTHGTKDYYDMTDMVRRYPDIHVTVNLTTSLLYQLQEYYVERLRPFVDVKANRVDADAYFAAYRGKTDPWIDLALKRTDTFDETDLGYLVRNTWNAFGVSEVMMERFPEYRKLKERAQEVGAAALTTQERLEIKLWFFVAHFDPDFLEHPLKLVTGTTVDLSDLIEVRDGGTYWLKRTPTESDCNRMIAETYKVLSAVVPLHRQLLYDANKGTGQIEVITTPFYHPILPLIYDSDLARICQPNDPMPERFHFPEDAAAQVQLAVAYFREIFGAHPTGMWPAEGSVANEIISVFASQGIRWIATDEKILARSTPGGMPKFQPYAVQSAEGRSDAIAIVFRDTELSDRIGFVYKQWNGRDAAEDLVQRILAFRPGENDPDRLLTIILDGENAWEWYKYDNDGKQFQNELYSKLTKLHQDNAVTTVTVTEYLDGNGSRGVPPHPVQSLPRINRLWPGSWINGNYDTWIGEREENQAWEYLLQARTDLAQSRPPVIHPGSGRPQRGTRAWYAAKAWQSLYAAEGSDWFWWYGTDQTAPAGDKPFDLGFITLLKNVYAFAEQAGAKMPQRDFHPIITESATAPVTSGGTMAQSTADMVKIVFQCDARSIYVRKAIYIVGNHEALGAWVPNKVRLYDDGSHGDTRSGDGIWALEVMLPRGTTVEYKFTNSGPQGGWYPGEEFPAENRKITVPDTAGQTVVLLDTFGKI